MQPTPQDIQLMSKRRVLSFKPQLRLEWRGQDGQNETEQSDHSASLGDSITSSTRISFSVHTRIRENREAERARLRALRMISLQRRVAIFRLLLGSAHANALRKHRNRPESAPAHQGDCKNSLEGRLVLGRDPLVPFEPAASATLISTASACLRTSIFGRL